MGGWLRGGTVSLRPGSQVGLDNASLRAISGGSSRGLDRKVTQTARSSGVVRVAADMNPSFLASDGTLYLWRDNNVYKSSDWGATTTLVYTLPTGNVSNAKRLDSGRVIATSTDGKIYRSDTLGANFTLVHTFLTPGTRAHDLFGLDVWETIVLAAEYKVTGDVDNARRVYLSRDEGATWTQIFEAPNVSSLHIHDVKFDPYEDIIWVNTGDSSANRMTYWSDDWGETWQQAAALGSFPRQFTYTIPLPECVLFLTDQQEMSVYRYDRGKGPIVSANALQLELAYQLRATWPVGEVPIGSYAAIKYGSDAYTIFGWTQSGTNCFHPSKLIATRDGREFFVIWSEDRIPVTDAGYLRAILGVFGPDDSNNVAVRFYSKYDNVNRQVLKVPVPDWTSR